MVINCSRCSCEITLTTLDIQKDSEGDYVQCGWCGSEEILNAEIVKVGLEWRF